MRTQHPGWSPRTISHYLACEDPASAPSRSAVYRALCRHGLIDPQRSRRRADDYRRWERSRPMELWQMDIMGGLRLGDGRECKIVTGIDDHSRYCVRAALTERATARPVCEALLGALQRHGAPEQILTDNGKVFTARFGAGAGEVLFDRICRENGIRHLLTAALTDHDRKVWQRQLGPRRQLPADVGRRRRASSAGAYVCFAGTSYRVGDATAPSSSRCAWSATRCRSRCREAAIRRGYFSVRRFPS